MKVALTFGTRPEAIKMAPVVKALKKSSDITTEVVLTAQHRELLDQALSVFGIRADRDLNVMQPRQTLAELNSRLIAALDSWLADSAPDLVVVQGDTTSTFVAALAAFYRGIPVAHVEAGLRTADPRLPFPEEMNRRLVSQLASLHFAPTDHARARLLAEGVDPSRVFLTGNTVVDALQEIRESPMFLHAVPAVTPAQGEMLVLVTMHRRESWDRIDQVCAAIAAVVKARPHVRVVFPVHPNPAVLESVHRSLGHVARVELVAPLDYVTFLKTIEASRVILSDSGGVQEEAPVFGRPVLILRETTERLEAIEAGVAKLVGTSTQAIVESLSRLLDDEREWARMATPSSPFGDGHAADRIAAIVREQVPVLTSRAAMRSV